MIGNQRGWLIAMGLAAVIGVGIRISSVFVDPIAMGYDAGGHWNFIPLLLRSWALPVPDEGWSTARAPLHECDVEQRDSGHYIDSARGLCALGLCSLHVVEPVVCRAQGERSVRSFVPFFPYASEVLADWTRNRNLRGIAAYGCLGLLVAPVMVTFSYGFVFEEHELPAIQRSPLETPWQG